MNNLLFIIAIICLFSCTNHAGTKGDVLQKFDSVNGSLDQANKLTDKSGREKWEELKRLRLSHPAAWAKAEKTRAAVDAFVGFIDTMKVEFVEYCGGEKDGQIPEKQEGAVKLSTDFFVKQGNGDKIDARIDRLHKALEDVGLTDSSKTLLNRLGMLPPAMEGQPHYHVFSRTYFENIPPVAAATLLLKFRNDALQFRSIIFNEYAKLVSSQQN